VDAFLVAGDFEFTEPMREQFHVFRQRAPVAAQIFPPKSST
jgi:hypothetical protein